MNVQRMFGEGSVGPVPQRVNVPAPEGVTVCPAFCGRAAAGWMEQVYRLAYDQAREALSPSWRERIVLSSMN